MIGTTRRAVLAFVALAAAPLAAAGDEHGMTESQYLEEIHYYVIAPCELEVARRIEEGVPLGSTHILDRDAGPYVREIIIGHLLTLLPGQDGLRRKMLYERATFSCVLNGYGRGCHLQRDPLAGTDPCRPCFPGQEECVLDDFWADWERP